MYKIKEMTNGFKYIEIKNSSAFAKISLVGANIFHYRQNDKEALLWLSEISDFKENKSIRGGIPICWPWFGILKNEKDLPQHGFARTSLFELININELNSGTTKITLRLKETKQSRQLWDYCFELELIVTVSDKLTMELKTTNKDTKTFEITQALHTYFQVTDISDAIVNGLDKKPYLDALTMKDEVQDGEIFFDKEIDRIYQEVDANITLRDKYRSISIDNIGSSSVVVWNPWIEKCSRMSAMKDSAYKTFVCIESANAFKDVVRILPNESHTLKATIF